MPKRYELTAPQWRRIEPLLPGKLGDLNRLRHGARDSTAITTVAVSGDDLDVKAGGSIAGPKSHL